MSDRLSLPMITLICMDTVCPEKAVKALEYSCRGIEFGDVVLVSHYKPDNFPDNFRYEYTPKCETIDEWNYKALFEMPKHVRTAFSLLCHSDGFVVSPDSWRWEFLDYDYIGAVWPLPSDDFSYRDPNGNLRRVGNSVSLRSKKLLDLPIVQGLEFKAFHGYANEDGFICVNYVLEYEKQGCKIAPIEVAKYFSREYVQEEGIEPFCFHKWHGLNAKYPSF